MATWRPMEPTPITVIVSSPNRSCGTRSCCRTKRSLEPVILKPPFAHAAFPNFSHCVVEPPNCFGFGEFLVRRSPPFLQHRRYLGYRQHLSIHCFDHEI